MNLKDDLNVQEKFLKVKNFSSSNRKVDKDDKEDVATITYKKKFIDSARFMAVLLSKFC